MTSEPMGEVASDWLTLETVDGPMQVYRVAPRAGDAVSPPAAVVVMQEAFGVNDHVQDVARRVAALGYLALAPDLFHRSGVDTVEYADRERAMALIGDLGPDPIIVDAAAVLAHLADGEGVPADRTAVIGFCFGGRAAFTAATALPVAGTVVFYGPGIAAGPHAVVDRIAQVTGPVLMLAGDADPAIPAEHLQTIEEAAAAAGIHLRVITFAGAGHAFHCDARPAMFVAAAAEQAWADTTAFLMLTVGGKRS
jgi:carboxymethylenebutenolidase